MTEPPNVEALFMTQLTPHPTRLTPADRSRLKPHRPAVLWFTGLSGSGKSTLANTVEYQLNTRYHAHTHLLDGDNIRAGLNSDLGFSDADRVENIRRIGEVCKLMADAGLIVLTAFISPFRADRERVRGSLPSGAFIEIYVRCPLAVCEQRDPKGLYAQARAGTLRQFTGIDSPYEEPMMPELTIDTSVASVEECAEAVIQFLEQKNIIDKPV
jgi:adenylyl-sulfate kinase